jgi:peptide deformylase
MSILKIARMGHPILRQRARDLTQEEIRSDRIKTLISDMIETMKEYDGVGLAAPQVHEPLQLAVIGFDSDSRRYSVDEGLPLTVFINPKVTPLTQELQTFWEGCLSVPGIRGEVSRPKAVRVDYIDTDFRTQFIEAEGFLATVLQHELDHLAGRLYLDRIDLTQGQNKIAFQEEYEKYFSASRQVV